jgi:ABC-type branched-subunit amino acid transport system substrate-binding protein
MRSKYTFKTVIGTVLTLLVIAVFFSLDPRLTTYLRSQLQSISQLKKDNFRAVSLLLLEGPYKSYGEKVRAGITLATEDILREHGDAFRVDFKSFDGSPTQAAEVFSTALQRDHYHFVLEVFGTSAMLGIVDIANSTKTVTISAVNTGYQLSDRMGKYCFRIIPSDAEAVKAMLAWAQDLGLHKAGIVSVMTDWGKGMKEMLQTHGSSDGSLISIEIIQDVEKTHSIFDPQVAVLKKRGIDVVFLALNPDQAANFANAVSRARFKTAIIGTDNLTAGEFTSGSGKNSLGVRYVLPPRQFGSPANDQQIASIKTRLGLAKDEQPHPFILYGYDATRILYNAIVASDGDTEKAVQYLEKISYEGLTGKVIFDEKHDVKLSSPYQRFQFRKGSKGVINAEIVD